MKHTLICMAVAAAALAPAAARGQSTQKFTAAKHNEYGLVYSLPTTHIRVWATTERTVCKAGPFHNYAKKYLGNVDVVTADTELWEIKSVSLSSFGVPNPDNSYLMQFKSGSAPYLVLSESGLPLSINEDAVEYTPATPEIPQAESSRLDNNAFANSLPVELLAAQSTAKRAEIAAQMIYKLRESRTAYVTGDVDQMPDGAALKIILEHIDEQEKDLIALFCGTTQKSTVVAEFDYLPEDETDDEVIFRLSDTNGIVGEDDLSGDPVRLSLTIDARGEMPVDDKGVTKKIPKGAVMYNIPGSATVSISYQGKTLCEKRVEVAQFGIDFGLDPDMFTDKKHPAFLLFHPETGGIKKLGVISETVSK